MDEARDAAFLAADAAVLAYRSADPPGQGNLGSRAEKSRVRSEDLIQEAEGLKQNSVDMGHTLMRLHRRWQQHAALMEEYLKDLGIMRRELDRLPEVSNVHCMC